MSDPSKLSTRQEQEVVKTANDRKKNHSSPGGNSKKKEAKQDVPLATYYQAGITIIQKGGYTIELRDGGDHCNHALLKPAEINEIKGIEWHKDFRPVQEIHYEDDLHTLSSLFNAEVCSQEVRDFWSPLFNPKPGESELVCFSARLLKMQKIKEKRNFSEPVNLGHTFDPMGSLTDGQEVKNPRIWVPAKEWFAPQLRNLKFSDVFTIFPEAEQKLLMLLIGRIGVGKSNHIPAGWKKPISHTARMAAVIVGKDAG